MTRRRRDHELIEDLFGFDPIGAEVVVSPDEARKLLGAGVLPLALYVVLKRYMRSNGRVIAASYYRFAEVLKQRNSGPGRRAAGPTRDQLRNALVQLARRDLVSTPAVENMRRGVLEIWIVRGVGGTASRSIGPGFRPGSRAALQ